MKHGEDKPLDPRFKRFPADDGEIDLSFGKAEAALYLLLVLAVIGFFLFGPGEW